MNDYRAADPYREISIESAGRTVREPVTEIHYAVEKLAVAAR